MSIVMLKPKRVLELIIAGIRNGNYQAAIDIAQDCIDQLEDDDLFSRKRPKDENKEDLEGKP